MHSSYYNNRKPASRSLCSMRMDSVFLLLCICFFMGWFIPSWLGTETDTSSAISRLFAVTTSTRDQNPQLATRDGVISMQRQVDSISQRLQLAEQETKNVFADNERLRLDNKVEQSNLKSLTKAKNDEIRELTAKIKDLEAGQQSAELGKNTEALSVRKDLQQAMDQNTQLQKQVEDLRKELQEARKTATLQSAKEADRMLVSVPPQQPLNTHWQQKLKDLFTLGSTDPAKLLVELDAKDPIGVMIDDVASYKCPAPDQQLTRPDLRDLEVARHFREGQGFVFFQHLRKAGGTGFCDLASRNMPEKVPSYFCMPDNRGSLATPPWTYKWFLEQIEAKDFRIVANEWDAFPRSLLGLPGAVFATTIRDPVDRWYSQYRFEHLEHRDGSEPDAHRQTFEEWYSPESYMGSDYFVKTFIGTENPPDDEVIAPVGPQGKPLVHGDFYWTYNKFRKASIEWQDFSAAVDTLRRFHLVLILEWLDHSQKMVEDVLGWQEAPRQVLPHEKSAPKRADKQANKAKELVGTEVYNKVRQDNALDTLFYHVARRIFLERSACGTL